MPGPPASRARQQLAVVGRVLDAEMLLDSREEQFDLPAALVRRADYQGRELSHRRPFRRAGPIGLPDAATPGVWCAKRVACWIGKEPGTSYAPGGLMSKWQIEAVNESRKSCSCRITVEIL